MWNYQHRNLKYSDKWRYLRDLLFDEIKSNVGDKYDNCLRINGHLTERLPNTLSLSFKNLRANEILDIIRPDVACSAGAACHDATSVTLSYVLQAMKVPKEFGMGTLRLSVGKYTTKEEIERAANIVANAVKQLYQRNGTSNQRFVSKL